MSHRNYFCCLLACTFAASAATVPAGVPPPGEYQIDSDAITTYGSGIVGLEDRTRTDGATGTVTRTTKGPDGSVATQVSKGDKPVTWCVRSATASDLPSASPFVCRTLKPRASATNSSFSAACRSLTVEDSFRKIDSRTWEHDEMAQVIADRSPVRNARAAIAMASAGMTPAQRAEAEKALSELPSDAQMDRMKADLLRQTEEAIRAAESPEDADTNRQILQALQQQISGTVVRQTIRIKERWTLLGTTCH